MRGLLVAGFVCMAWAAGDSSAQLVNQLPWDGRDGLVSLGSLGSVTSIRAADDYTVPGTPGQVVHITQLRGTLLTNLVLLPQSASFEIYPDSGVDGPANGPPVMTLQATDLIDHGLIGSSLNPPPREIEFVVGTGLTTLFTQIAGERWWLSVAGIDYLPGSGVAFLGTFGDGGPLNGSEGYVRINGGDWEAGGSCCLEPTDFAFAVEGSVAPPNDFCAGAHVAAVGETPFDNINAASDGPPTVDCDSEGVLSFDHDVWFVYQAPAVFADCTSGSRLIGVSVCGSSFDTRLAVYGSVACPPVAVVACSDNSAGCAGGMGAGSGSRLSFMVMSGQSYLIRVGSAVANVTGSGALFIDEGAATNDACEDALEVGVGPTHLCNQVATNSGPVPGEYVCGLAAIPQRDLWFKHTVALAGFVVFRVCADQPVSMHLVQGDSPGVVRACCSLDSDECAAFGAEIGIMSAAGEEWLIRVGSRGPNPIVGELMLEVCCAADANASGGVETPDVFEYLSRWFAADARADFDQSQVVDVPDIFVFLSAWFDACD